MTFEKQNPERKREQKRYMEASNSVVKEVKNKTTSLETEKFKIINSFQNHIIKNHIIQPGPVICFTLDSIHVSMLFS